MIWLSALGFGNCPRTAQTQVWLFAAALSRLFNLSLSPFICEVRVVITTSSGLRSSQESRGGWRVPASQF